ncbi:MAG: VCBS repeat-containing protein [Verrucomicrobia bacterium]|nr:VCBS repeat-containing protein [Verrucomicrobiota bacterium]
MKSRWFTVGLGCALICVSALAHADGRLWRAEAGFRWAEFGEIRAGHTGFNRLSPAQTGIVFSNTLSEASIAANRVMANGSGVAVGDYDNDGLPDLYACGLETPNALYRNLGGWRFKDTATETGVACERKACRGAVFADLNGDGFLDLLVSTLGEGVLCFLNDGHGKFVDHTANAGTRSSFGSTTMALADVDGNGTLDLYVANYRPNDVRDTGRLSFSVVGGKPMIAAKDRDRFLFRGGQLAEYGQPDQLFLNDGTGRFRQVRWDDGTFLDEQGQRLAAPPLDWGLTATFRDVNHDSAPDLYVCNDFWTPDRFWINDGHGRFKLAEKLALRKTSSSSMGVDFADFDRDGDLDFFVLDMLSRDSRLRKRQMFAEKPEPRAIGLIDDRPQVMRNTLFRNRGDGTFAEIADYGRVPASEWSWSPVFLDVDLDGYEDLIIPAGHFRDVQDLDASMEISARQHSWKDFKDEVQRQKVFTQELMEHYRLYPLLKMPVVAFRNLQNWRFEEVTEQWGLDHAAVHHGIAFGDFDADGDPDLAVNCLNGVLELYRNVSTAGRVAVRLKGRPPNTQGIGAKISLHSGAVPVQTTEIISGGRYLSGSEALAVFATASKMDGMSLEVHWRSGGRSTVPGVVANRVYEIDEAGAAAPVADVTASERQGGGQPRVRGGEPVNRGIGVSATNHNDAVPLKADRQSQIGNRRSQILQSSTLNAQPFFQDVSVLLSHTHHELDYNDFERQPLLPFKLSQSGPGLAWFDLDGDDHDDLVIGAGPGGTMSLYRSDGRGVFTSINATNAAAIPCDLAGLAGWNAGFGGNLLLAGLTGYEGPTPHAAVEIRLERSIFRAAQPVATEMSSAGPLALGDLDGSGQPVLFVGGGVSPGRYPLGAPSKIYRHENGRWRLDVRNSLLLENLGIVNGAVWSDLTGDGFPELVLACEWGPIRIFQKRDGALFEVTAEMGLSEFKGWWKGVATGDFNGDGRMDIVAANWGLNSPYSASKERPLTLAYGEIFRPGVVDLIETEYDSVTGSLAPRRQIASMAASLPFFFERFSSHKAYSEASLEEALGERKVLSRRVEVTTLASLVFLNTGGRFEEVELPREAQLAPAFSVNVADFDGDGNEDVFLSQNFFATQPEMPRLDAGRGLWLKGDGKGLLEAVPGWQSGIRVYGEQRGAAVGDFDEDGRADLAVSQNGVATKLYRNVRATRGLRIKLKGVSGNPRGVGAVIRLQFGDRLGPAREIHAGSGYWSQDSATQVMGTSSEPTAVWVRWPGGRVTTTPVTGKSLEVIVGLEEK